LRYTLKGELVQCVLLTPNVGKRQEIPLQRMCLWDGIVGTAPASVQKSAENWEIFCLNGGAEGDLISCAEYLLWQNQI
jgi:hypothetical protein